MSVVAQLGINETIVIQFFVFAVAYLALYFLVFKNYYKTFEEREARTKGSEELAVELHRESAELYTQYEQKAREVSLGIKAIFDENRSKALKEYDQIVGRAKEEANKLIEATRVQVVGEVASATQKLKDEVPQVAQAISQKLLSKG